MFTPNLTKSDGQHKHPQIGWHFTKHLSGTTISRYNESGHGDAHLTDDERGAKRGWMSCFSSNSRKVIKLGLHLAGGLARTPVSTTALKTQGVSFCELLPLSEAVWKVVLLPSRVWGLCQVPMIFYRTNRNQQPEALFIALRVYIHICRIHNIYIIFTIIPKSPGYHMEKQV